MTPSIDKIVGRTKIPNPLPKRVLTSKEELLKKSAELTKKLDKIKKAQAKYDPVKLGIEKRYFLQQEIITRLALNPTERQILLEYSSLDRRLGEAYRQSLRGESANWANSIDVLNQAKLKINGLSKDWDKHGGIDKFKLQKEIDEAINKILKNPKKEFIPTELIAKIKNALIAVTNQRIGYDIHKTIVEMSRRIDHP